MHTVRKNGNLGAHGERLSPQIACDTLEQLHYIVGEVLINLNLIDDYPTFESPLEKARARRQAPGKPAATPQTQTPTAVRAASSAMPEPAPCAPKHSQQPCEPSDDVVAQYAETLLQAHFSTRRRAEERKALRSSIALRSGLGHCLMRQPGIPRNRRHQHDAGRRLHHRLRLVRQGQSPACRHRLHARPRQPYRRLAAFVLRSTMPLALYEPMVDSA